MASERIEKLLAAQQKAEAQKRKAEQQLKAAKHKISMQRIKSGRTVCVNAAGIWSITCRLPNC